MIAEIKLKIDALKSLFDVIDRAQSVLSSTGSKKLLETLISLKKTGTEVVDSGNIILRLSKEATVGSEKSEQLRHEIIAQKYRLERFFLEVNVIQQALYNYSHFDYRDRDYRMAKMNKPFNLLERERQLIQQEYSANPGDNFDFTVDQDQTQ